MYFQFRYVYVTYMYILYINVYVSEPVYVYMCMYVRLSLFEYLEKQMKCILCSFVILMSTPTPI